MVVSGNQHIFNYNRFIGSLNGGRTNNYYKSDVLLVYFFGLFGEKACIAEERANKSSDFIDLLVGQDETLPII